MRLFDVPPFQATVISFSLLGLSCTFRSLSGYRTASYPYIPTPSSPCPHTELCLVVFNGGGFRSASEVLSCQEEKAARRWWCSPQFLAGLSPVFWHLIPRWGPKAFWGSDGTVWVQKSLWGTGHTVRTQKAYGIGRHTDVTALLFT